jgi:hypothetical protein
VRRVEALVEGIHAGLLLKDAINSLEGSMTYLAVSEWVASAGNAALTPGVTLLFTVP